MKTTVIITKKSEGVGIRMRSSLSAVPGYGRICRPFSIEEKQLQLWRENK